MKTLIKTLTAILFATFSANAFTQTTYTVTNTGDNGGVNPAVSAGTGTLRQAIVDANASASANDTIIFTVGTSTITLASALPALTGAGVTINGGGTPNTALTGGLNGTLAVTIDGGGLLALTVGMAISSDNNIIKGLNFINVGTTGGLDKMIDITAGADNNQILGCYIGTDVNGTASAGANTEHGVHITDGANNKVGDGTAAGRNLISGLKTSSQGGVRLWGALATGNSIKGNIVGLQKDGATFLSTTQQYGVTIVASAASNTIGGTVLGEGNVISGNRAIGVVIGSITATSNLVVGNIIGPNADGISNVVSNAQSYGVYITNAAGNTIGGSAPGSGNIISANLSYGVYITVAGSTVNVVRGNYIGPGSSLGNIMGSSQDYGVYITSSAANNTIGGSATGEANTIAFNTVQGVYVSTAAATGNRISHNPIYSNGTPIGTGKPINLNYGASQGNNGKIIPVITTANTTTVVGNSGAGDSVEVFKNTTGNCNDAVTFVGSATADGAGNWSLAVSLSNGDYVLATATDASNNTSEFSPCVVSLPVELLYFSANCKAPSNSPKGGEVVVLNWTTASETNNNFFTIERSLSPSGGGTGGGLAFAQIGTVKGAGNSSTIRKYEFIDGQLETLNLKPETILYYRLSQTDFNGTAETFSPVSVSCSGNSGFSVTVNPNPISDGNIYVSVNGAADENVLVVITDVLGREMYSKIILEPSDGYLFNINLQNKIAHGVYFVTASANDKYFSKKIVVE